MSTYSERMIHGFTGKPFSLGGPDTPSNPRQAVLDNRQRLLEELGFAKSQWIIPQQVHGHRIGRTGDQHFHQTDGVLLTRPGHPVMLLYADCVPVMLYDPTHHVGAVGHAGWRGTAQQIAREAVIALQNTCGSVPGEIVAAIGPAISLCCFQVSREVTQAMADSLQLTLAQLEKQGFLVWDEHFPDNPRLDLKALNRYQLEQTGIQQVDVLTDCTRCSDDTLFSYRRKEDGRNSAFMILQ